MVERGNQQITLAWSLAPEISRDSPAVDQIAQAIGLSSADTNQLFVTAAAIAV